MAAVTCGSLDELENGIIFHFSTICLARQCFTVASTIMYWLEAMFVLFWRLEIRLEVLPSARVSWVSLPNLLNGQVQNSLIEQYIANYSHNSPYILNGTRQKFQSSFEGVICLSCGSAILVHDHVLLSQLQCSKLNISIIIGNSCQSLPSLLEC